MRPPFFLVGSAVLAALLPFHTFGSYAGTAIRMDVESLVETADLVLEGRVLATRCVEDSLGQIVTDCEVEVDRTFSGEHRERRTLRLPGGVLESGRGLMIPGLPSLRAGEDVILALSEAGKTGVRLPTGLNQGKFRIVTGSNGLPQAIRGGVGGALLDADGVEEAGAAESMSYAELVARLEAAANAKANAEQR